MGGGDLNFKKSWHPQKSINREKVWLAENKAEEEAKKVAQLRKETEEQRQLEEMHALQVKAGLKAKTDRVEFMYASTVAQNKGIVDDKEEYLLGRKKVDKLLAEGDGLIEGDNEFNTGKIIDMNDANTLRDTQAKIRDDPLTTIMLNQKASLQRYVNNPIFMNKLTKEKKSKKEKKGKKHKKNKKEKRYEDDNLTEEENAKKLRASRYNRSPSPNRNKDSRNGRDSHRDRSISPNSHRDSHSYRANHRGRSPTISHRRNRSPSPVRRRDDRDRHSSLKRIERSPRSPRQRSPTRSNENRDRRSNYTVQHNRSSTPESDRHNNVKASAQEREAKLKAMMEDARTNETQRQQRLAQIEKEEIVENFNLSKERRRHYDDLDGDVAEFLNDARNAAYNSTNNLDLGARIQRQRNKLTRGD